VSYLFSRFDQMKATGALPSPQGVALEILRLTQAEDTSISQLAHVLQADPALAGRLVRFANSTQAGAMRPVVAIGDAVRMLGFAVVRQLALGFSVLATNRDGRCPGFDYPGFWSRSLATALAGQMLCARGRVLSPEEGFTCGLLCDIGSLALASLHPEAYGELLASGLDGGERLVAERERFGTDRIELTAALLEDWRLPRVFVDAVFHSDQPERAGFEPGSRARRLADSVGLARLIGQSFTAEATARERLVAPVLSRSAQFGIDPTELPAFYEMLGEAWKRWGGVLSLDLGPAPAFEVPDPGVGIAPAGPEHAIELEATDPGVTLAPSPEAERSVVVAGRRSGLRLSVAGDVDALEPRLPRLLEAAGHECRRFKGVPEALEAMLSELPDGVLLAADSAGALEAGCARLRETAIGARVYVLGLIPAAQAGTLAEEASLAVVPADAGPDDVLPAPFTASSVGLRLRTLRRALARREGARRTQEDTRRLATELSVANRRLRRAALVDALTGLPNRRYAIDRLEQEWSSALRHARALSCLAIDVDAMPEGGGHSAADRALAMLAGVLRDGVRAHDVLCRIGDTRFLAIAPVTDGAGAVEFATRLRDSVTRRFGTGDGESSAPVQARGLTVSIGVATMAKDLRDPESLLQLAESALQTARSAGPAQVYAAG
jgi:two-component system cell cycle response regulator